MVEGLKLYDLVIDINCICMHLTSCYTKSTFIHDSFMTYVVTCKCSCYMKHLLCSLYTFLYANYDDTIC